MGSDLALARVLGAADYLLTGGGPRSEWSKPDHELLDAAVWQLEEAIRYYRNGWPEFSAFHFEFTASQADISRRARMLLMFASREANAYGLVHVPDAELRRMCGFSLKMLHKVKSELTDAGLAVVEDDGSLRLVMP